MSQNEVISVMSDAIMTVVRASLPMLIIAIVVGLIVSIFQATTQIHEQTLAFVPKIVAILLALLIFGGYIITTLTDFFQRHYGYISSILG